MKKLLCILLITCSQVVAAQSRIENLEKAFDTFLKDPQAKFATTSICILDANTGKKLFARNENIGVSTASTLKTITAATAFQLLGKDFVYETKLGYNGELLTDGTLNGNLIISGTGDPTLGSWRYDKTKENNILTQWTTAIKQAGIMRINGYIIGDDSAWPTASIPKGWLWEDIGNYYGAGSYALSWRENQFDLTLKPGINIGDSVKIVKTTPSLPFIKFQNELTTSKSGSGDNAYAFLAPYTNEGYLRGTWGIGISKKGISVSTPDPAYAVAYALMDTLNRLGIPSNKATTSRILLNNGQYPILATTNLLILSSPKLSEIIYWFCKKSINLYGEALLRTFASVQGKPATTENGISAEIAYWKQQGIDPHALNIKDGSGLSPTNKVTTAALAEILFKASKESWFPQYYNAFPDYNNMKIKSGTISDVSAYAGYHTDVDGNKYAIVININNYNGIGISQKLFKVLDTLK